ncbi:DsbA family protein [Noviherbaspirillum saxi]|uniref:DsbA family protein n=1 Tax=Noviherbaspirillum saxi TaxID=2320863 RepID=A0A3A3FRV0_9BURK|nr:DsbA family protein [Noviherbaspirillum saxi]RJF96192.1 DsbA family protein [Noviherbaspirillum saxi]
MPSLLYIADPMCSWCYGFGPELTALLEGLPGLPVNIVVGGLRAYTTETMDDALRTSVRGHWKQIGERTGLPFADTAALDEKSFVYNTEPACRAVVAARMLAPQAALAVFHAIQHAFYAEGKDVTQDAVLASVASAVLTQAGVPTNEASFLVTLKSEAAVMATYQDFEQTKRWGITGFPTLVLERDGKLDMVTAGYVAMPTLIELLQALVDKEAIPEES